MITREDLESLPAGQLHERAFNLAKTAGDIDWFWHLLGSIPAADGELGELDESGLDIASLITAINGYIRSDRTADETVLPQCVDYILEHL